MKGTHVGAVVVALVLVTAVVSEWAVSDEVPGSTPSAAREIQVPEGYSLWVYTLGGDHGRHDVVKFAPASLTSRYRVTYEPEHQLLQVRVAEGDRFYDYAFVSPLRWDLAKLD